MRRYLDSRFDRLESRLERLDGAGVPKSAQLLGRVDVTEHNTGRTPPGFDHVVSQAVSAAQFAHPDFERLSRILYPTATLPWGTSPISTLHRKVWEFVYVLRVAEQFGVLREGGRAVGFGVGQEPIPAALAAHGVSVLATDLDASEDVSREWAETGQHLATLASLSMPDIVSDEILERRVGIRFVDMNAIPDDLGSFDFIWSCCALEHLGSPRAGLDFVARTLELLEPGGLCVHTTELELTSRATTADYGNISVYRIADLEALAREVRGRGFTMETNWYVALETAADRWIGHPPYDDPAHLKLVIGDSISTSVGLVIHRPG